MAGNKPRKESQQAIDNIRTPNRRINYKCMLDEDDCKYYCYKKVQGRWVQCNGLPYDSQDECEKALEMFQ